MDFGLTNKVIGDLRDLNFACQPKDELLLFLAQLQQWRGMFDAVGISAARRLQELSVRAPAELAAATQRHGRSGNTVFERAATLSAVPALAEPLQAAMIHGAHVDTVAKVMRTVQDEYVDQFNETLPNLIEEAIASRANPDELARMLTKVARKLENDDGMSRFEKQRRDTALRTWTDKRNGMFRISGTFDPLSGALLNGHLDAAMAAIFAEKTPFLVLRLSAGASLLATRSF